MADRHLVTSDGATLHYVVGGAGDPAIVFVHGWCSRASHWDAQLTHFAPSHLTLAVDRRGHGLSAITADGYRAEQHARDLADVLDREGIRSAVVVAHAGGCPTALELAHRRPELVGTVVLIDTHLSPATDLDTRAGEARPPLGVLLDQLDGDDGDAVFEAMYASFFSAHAGEVGRRALDDALQVPRTVAVAELASLAVDTERLARQLHQPVLWLSVDDADTARLSGLFRAVTFGRVVGSGHFPHLEVPDQVDAMIARFLEVVAAPPTPRHPLHPDPVGPGEQSAPS